MVILTAFGAAAVIGALTFTRPRTYTAAASFTPQATRSQVGALGGLAAQLGVVVPGTDGNQSPQFYADLLGSRTVLEPLVRLPVAFEWRGRRYAGTYENLTLPAGMDSLERTEAAVRSLDRAMAVAVAPRTGVVALETTTRFPQLSAILTDSALGQLNSFNVQTRRSQAAAQRQFLEERLTSVSRELQAAEDAVRDFAQRNRGDLRSAPELLIQRERLERNVMLRSEVHSNLAQALEQAKLDEIRDTPLITVIERARPPVYPDPRGLAMTTVISFVVGLFIGAVAALVRHAIAANQRDRPDSFREVSAEFAAAKEDLKRMVWPVRRRVPSRTNGS